MKDLRTLVVATCVAIVLLLGSKLQSSARPAPLTYEQFVSHLATGKVQSATVARVGVQTEMVNVTLAGDATKYVVTLPLGWPLDANALWFVEVA